MTFDQIISDLEKKIYYPVYLLFGDEPYYLDEITKFIEENVLSETEKEFNQTVLYGRDARAGTIIDYAKRYPMMSNYQVVIVKEAQDLSDFDQLQPYFEKPLTSTLLILVYKYKKLDKRRAFMRKIDKTGVLFESKKLYDNKIPDWITGYLTKRGYTISPKACYLLAEYLGTGLSKIRNELDKLTINTPEGAQINEETIEKNIGISKDYNIFELHNALGKKDIIKANRIVAHFGSNPRQNPMVVSLAMLYNFFIKILIYHRLKDKTPNHVAASLSINPYFVNDYAVAARNYSARKLRDIIGMLREYDLKVKGINNYSTSDGELLRELVFKILH